MLNSLELRTRQAVDDNLAHSDFLFRLLLDEVERRDAGRHSLEQRMRRASFEHQKTFDDFDFSFNPKIPKPKVTDLATCLIVARKDNALLIGHAGVGKSHIAQAIGHRACRAGHAVLYVEASDMLKSFRAARADGSYDRRMLRFTTPAPPRRAHARGTTLAHRDTRGTPRWQRPHGRYWRKSHHFARHYFCCAMSAGRTTRPLPRLGRSTMMMNRGPNRMTASSKAWGASYRRLPARFAAVFALSGALATSLLAGGCSSAPADDVGDFAVENVVRGGDRVLVERDSRGNLSSELSIYADEDVTLIHLTVFGARGPEHLRSRTSANRVRLQFDGSDGALVWEGRVDERQSDAVTARMARVAEPLERWTTTHLADQRIASHYNGARPSNAPTRKPAEQGNVGPRDLGGDIVCGLIFTLTCLPVTGVPGAIICSVVSSVMCNNDGNPFANPTSCGSGKCAGRKTCTSCERDCGRCHSAGGGSCEPGEWGNVPAYC